MNYEVILERNSFAKVLCTFKYKKEAQAYIDFNYDIIEDWFEERVDFNIIKNLDKLGRPYETYYENSNRDTTLYVRRLTK